MPYFLFTFRPQVSEQQLFEDFLTIFLPILKEFPKYSYSVEEDNTLQKHIHCLLEHTTAKDNSKFLQLFNKKIFIDFKKSLLTKQTNEHGFDNRKVQDTPEDLIKVLGYVNKETQCLRRGYSGFTNEEVLDAVNFYYTTKHIEKASKINDDWTILTTKNAHITIEKFVLDNNLNWDDFMIEQIIIIKMKESKYSFINFNKKTLSTLFSELIIANGKDNDNWHYKKEGHVHEDEGACINYDDMIQTKMSLMISKLKELGIDPDTL